jgi:LCP family protein required for cell wall assembly
MFGPSSSDSLQTNFLVGQDEQRSRKQTIVMAVVFACIVGCLATLGAYASYRIASTQTEGRSSAWQLLQGLPGMNQIIGPDPKANPNNETATKERLNILLLGVGGEGHEGAQLTDTIILASINLKEKKVAMLSIPRDLAYPLGGGRFEKINSVQAYFERDYPGEGATRTAQAFATLLEMPIDHVVRIDFNGFADFVDALGGIDVTVERGFTDPQYPTNDKGWMVVSFRKGLQHFNGENALRYARSRHGNNGEGSDFARSRRQQLVILAIREKLLRLDTLGDPRKLAALYSAVTNHLQSDLSPWEAMKLAPLFKDFSTSNLTMKVLDDQPGHELVSANVNGAFMLFPRKPDWSEIREIAQNPFTSTSTSSVPNPDPIVLKSKIEVRNGTLRTGFAAQIAAMLERNGFEVKGFGNAIRRGYEETVIYDLSQGRKQDELRKLQRLLNASVSLSPPTRENTKDGLAPEKASSNDVDFLVVLGEASYPLLQTTPYVSP